MASSGVSAGCDVAGCGVSAGGAAGCVDAGAGAGCATGAGGGLKATWARWLQPAMQRIAAKQAKAQKFGRDDFAVIAGRLMVIGSDPVSMDFVAEDFGRVRRCGRGARRA